MSEKTKTTFPEVETKKVQMAAGAAEIMACIEQTARLHGFIINALLKSYDEQQIDFAGSDENKHLVGYEMFEALLKVRDELFKILQDIVTDDLYTRENYENPSLGVSDYLKIESGGTY